jgi:hypothetical protein
LQHFARPHFVLKTETILLRYISCVNCFISPPGHEQVLVFLDCRRLPTQPMGA